MGEKLVLVAVRQTKTDTKTWEHIVRSQNDEYSGVHEKGITCPWK